MEKIRFSSHLISIVLILLLHNISLLNGKLLTSLEVSEGLCPEPGFLPVAEHVNYPWLLIGRRYYVPMASKHAIRKYAEVFLGRPAHDHRELDHMNLQIEHVLGKYRKIGYEKEFRQLCLSESKKLRRFPRNLLERNCYIIRSWLAGEGTDVNLMQQSLDTVVWTDNHTAILVTKCINHKYYDWEVYSTGKELLPWVRDQILSVVQYLGFDLHNVVYYDYEHKKFYEKHPLIPILPGPPVGLIVEHAGPFKPLPPGPPYPPPHDLEEEHRVVAAPLPPLPHPPPVLHHTKEIVHEKAVLPLRDYGPQTYYAAPPHPHQEEELVHQQKAELHAQHRKAELHAHQQAELHAHHQTKYGPPLVHSHPGGHQPHSHEYSQIIHHGSPNLELSQVLEKFPGSQVHEHGAPPPLPPPPELIYTGGQQILHQQHHHQMPAVTIHHRHPIAGQGGLQYPLLPSYTNSEPAVVENLPPQQLPPPPPVLQHVLPFQQLQPQPQHQPLLEQSQIPATVIIPNRNELGHMTSPNDPNNNLPPPPLPHPNQLEPFPSLSPEQNKKLALQLQQEISQYYHNPVLEAHQAQQDQQKQQQLVPNPNTALAQYFNYPILSNLNH